MYYIIHLPNRTSPRYAFSIRIGRFGEKTKYQTDVLVLIIKRLLLNIAYRTKEHHDFKLRRDRTEARARRPLFNRVAEISAGFLPKHLLTCKLPGK